MIGLTTGRQTNQRLNTLLKELAHTIPHAHIIRRGKSSLEELGQRLIDEGSDYGIIIQRWHGAPGRIDFYRVQPSFSRIPPSIILKGVKLKREYADSQRGVAQAITYDREISKSSLRLVSTLCMVLGLSESKPPHDPKMKTSIHVGQLADGTIRITVTSPPAGADIGPNLLISRLIWDISD